MAVESQMVLPGLAEFFKTKISRGAEKCLLLLRWMKKKHGNVFPSQQWIARHFKVDLRTVIRWIAELKRIGQIQVQKRGPRSAVYKIVGSLSDLILSSRAASLLTESKSNKKEKTGRVLQMPKEPRVSYTIPLGYEEPVVRILQIAIKAGKPIGHRDAARTAAALRSQPPDKWPKIIEFYERLCMETKETKFIPWPVNFINSEAWDRVAAPRTLPYVPPATEKKTGLEKAREDFLRMQEILDAKNKRRA